MQKVAVLGCPNVGKSSLVNRLSGRREAVVHATAGVTRDRNEVICEWNGREFALIDTGGIDFAEQGSLARSIRAQARAGLADADAALLVIDLHVGIQPGDEELADMLRKDATPTLVVANKCDHVQEMPLAAELYKLGLGSPAPVSAAQGLGTGDLLDAITDLLPDRVAESAQQKLRLAILGRPNVGKSSLVNRFLGQERVIVSAVAGTTRDAIDTELTVDGNQLVIVDTAGMRRQSKVADSVEHYTSLRSRRAAERADVALVVCDATAGVTSQDMRIAEIAMKAGCATAVVLNKWDIFDGSEADLLHERAKVAAKLRLRPRVLTASALTGRGASRLLSEALALGERMTGRISTASLNRFLAETVQVRQPPARTTRRGGGARRLRLLYMAQVARRPPRFAIQVNSRAMVTRDYAYFIENRLRARFALAGVPLVIDFVERGSRRAPVSREEDEVLGDGAEPDRSVEGHLYTLSSQSGRSANSEEAKPSQ